MTRASFLLIALSSLVLPSCDSVSLGGSDEDGGVQTGDGSAFGGSGGNGGTSAIDAPSLGGQGGGGTSGTGTCGPRTFDADCFGGATIYTCVQRAGEWVWDYRCPEVSLDGGPRQVDAQPFAQHPYVSTGAACINYPVSGYRVFPYDPTIRGGRTWPTCTLNCATVTPSYGPAGNPALDQALPAGSCEDEGATCDAPVLTGWCSPCADVGGPGNGYTCVCRGHTWHCAVTMPGLNMCGPATCVDPSRPYNPLTTTCRQITWSDTQVCACGVCRDLCDSDAQCSSGRCKLNQVCKPSTDNCTGPDECPAPCRGLCEPVTDGGVVDSGPAIPVDAGVPGCPGENPAARTCRNFANECIPSTCTCGGLVSPTSTWGCTADCRALPLCADGGATDDGGTCSDARIDNSQATTAFAQYTRQVNSGLNPAATFSAEEKNVAGLWDAMQAQLFFGKIFAEDGSVFQEVAFLYRQCKVTPLADDQWFGLIQSGVVVNGALYYSWQWGSGISRTSMGKMAPVTPGGPGLVKITSVAYLNRDLVVVLENEQLAVYQAVVNWGKLNEWQSRDAEPIGFLKDFGDRLAVVDESGKELSTTH